ncbi:hypothetical protein D3C72_1791200 [compost metagenome]
MPVGREALDAEERGRGDVGHHLERQVDHAHEGEMPENDGAERQRRHRPERRKGRVPGHLVGGGTGHDRIDQPTGVERRQDIGERRKQDGAQDEGKAKRLALPMNPGEAENAAERTAAQGETSKSHNDCPMPGALASKFKSNETCRERETVFRSAPMDW